MSRRPIYGALFAASLAANLVQVLFVLPPYQSLYADMGIYIDWAKRLASGEGRFRTLDLFYPPGTSLFYSFFFRILTEQSALTAIAVVQAIALAAANLFLALMVETIFRRRALGYGTYGIAALYWPFTALASFYLAEPLFIFFAMLGQYLCARGIFRNRNTGSIRRLLFSAGLCFACASLVKSQGLLFLFGPLLMIIFGRLRASAAAVLIAGYLFGSIPQLHLRGTQIRFGAANDAFNIYLGQSRRQGVGAYNPATGEFYVFFNNNSRVPHLFRPPEIVTGSLIDRNLFFEKTATLWHQSPRAQLLASLQNAVELWLVRKSWPLENIAGFSGLDLSVQWLGALLITFPAMFFFTVGVVRSKYSRAVVLFAAAPLIGITAVAFLSTGQSRYLLPFYYNLIPFGILGLAELRRSLTSVRGALAPLGFTAAFALVLTVGDAICETYAASIPPREHRSSNEMHLLGTIEPRPTGRAFGFAFAEDLSTYERGNLRMELDGFYPGFAFGEETHAVSASPVGKIRIRFPAGSATHVATWMVDPDSFLRASLVRLADRTAIAQALSSGRWIVLPLSAEQRSSGYAELKFERLLGSSVLVSAVILYSADPEKTQ